MKTPYIVFLLLLSNLSFSQDVRIYHGEKAESVYLKGNENIENASRESVPIIRGTDGIVSICILNPNPFFYKYEIKTEDVEIVDEYSNQFADLVKLLINLPDVSDHFKGITARETHTLSESKFTQYRNALENLKGEIEIVKDAIEKSDHPETIREAFDRIANNNGYGFRSALGTIEKQSTKNAHFNSSTLLKDLNELLEAAIKDSSFNLNLSLGIKGTNPTLEDLYKEAFMHLNSNLAATINSIIDITKKDRILRFKIPIKENKNTKVRLIITQINKDDKTIRELIDEEVANVYSLYKRKQFEVVPCIDLVFQESRKKFSVENDLIVSTPDDDAKFNIGAMALVNFASFGAFKEYGIGLGISYSIQTDGKCNGFFALPSLSYKDIFRIGYGVGYNLAPVGLKGGTKVGDPMPANISNVEDILDYRRKLATVLTISIAGIKF